MKNKTILIITVSLIMLISNFISGAIDPALIFCKDAGYEIEDREDGPYCISSEGIGCNVWNYYCKCDNKMCWSNMNVSDCNLPCPEIPCIEEGEYNTIYECCEGLKHLPRDTSYVNVSNGSCEYSGWIGPQGGICSDCGNGNCEEWENKCNCPEDCPMIVGVLPPLKEKLNWMYYLIPIEIIILISIIYWVLKRKK